MARRCVAQADFVGWSFSPDVGRESQGLVRPLGWVDAGLRH
jgi:hypothetical protein